MKRCVSLMIALVMCLTLACPVLAEEFVPSINAKDAPSIVTVKDDQGKDAIGELIDENDNVVGYLYEECLVITPVSQAKTSTLIPDQAEELLLDVYAKLNDGSMSLPYEKLKDNVDPATMVIRDLFDVSWLCGEGTEMEGTGHPDHPTEVAPKGIRVRLIFDLDVSAIANVYCMSYKNDAWNPVVSCVNNGDGTVTAVFEDFCPVAFSVGSRYTTPPAATGDPANIVLWIVVMVVSIVALGAVVILSNRRNVR